MISLRTLALITSTSLAAAMPAGASAASGSETQSAGTVSATLSYETSTDSITSTLTITRDGQVAFSGPIGERQCGSDGGRFCGPVGAIGDAAGKSLTVAGLDGSGEPQVVVKLYSGGAHCCTYSTIARWTGSSYVLSSRNWGDPGFRIADLGGDGRLEFLSADDRFAYAFASYAASGLPLEILRYDAGRFSDVTGQFPARVRKDAAMWWRDYRSIRGRADARGLIAAWAADRYRLGGRRSALRTRRRAAAGGDLGGRRSARRFVGTLDRRLRAWGYAR